MVHFKCCGHGQKISVFIPQKFEFLEMLLLVTVLRLCIPSGDYSSCLDRSFWILGKISKKQSLFERSRKTRHQIYDRGTGAQTVAHAF